MGSPVSQLGVHGGAGGGIKVPPSLWSVLLLGLRRRNSAGVGDRPPPPRTWARQSVSWGYTGHGGEGRGKPWVICGQGC
jgi:hypothetical protein